MKAIINGRFIIPDETGHFAVEEGLALFFDEKIRAIRPAATVSAAEREELKRASMRAGPMSRRASSTSTSTAASAPTRWTMTRRPSAKCSCSRQRQA